jgi:hypothetical protein
MSAALMTMRSKAQYREAGMPRVLWLGMVRQLNRGPTPAEVALLKQDAECAVQAQEEQRKAQAEAALKAEAEIHKIALNLAVGLGRGVEPAVAKQVYEASVKEKQRKPGVAVRKRSRPTERRRR